MKVSRIEEDFERYEFISGDIEKIEPQISYVDITLKEDGVEYLIQLTRYEVVQLKNAMGV